MENDLDAQSQASTPAQSTTRKRIRTEDSCIIEGSVQKRQKAFTATGDRVYEETVSDSVHSGNPIDYWRNYQRWPQTFFKSNSNMSQPLIRKRSIAFRRKASKTSNHSSETTPSENTSWERKGSIYKDKRCDSILASHNCFLKKDAVGVTPQSKTLCKELLETGQPVPEDSLFNDDLFEETCDFLTIRNKAAIIRDIALLIVPSAVQFARRGTEHLTVLTETISECWSESIPLLEFQPQPDYSVGFDLSRFPEDLLKKLKPFIGRVCDESTFAATWYMHFPFFSCEIKCGAAALDTADRQNAHSMSLAVRAVVELYRLVKRENELNREILAFSVSHDHRSVRIYGHYPVVDEQDTKYYRYPIHDFSFTALNGKDKWTAYRFTKNVYDNWLPVHFKRICSAIDKIPSDVSFDVSQESELHFSTGQSQYPESRVLSQSEDTASVTGLYDGSSVANFGDMTPNTSLS